jgi:hypothetical protein
MKVITFMCLMVSGCSLLPPKPDVSGTYELIVCKEACSFDNPQAAIAHGVIVLFNKPLSHSDVQKIDPYHFSEPYEVVRACFAGHESKDAESFAFGGSAGARSWSLKGNTLTFSLLRSIDAGYSVDAEYKGDSFSGKGASWGAGVAAPGYTPDIVLGRRVSPADITALTAVSVLEAPEFAAGWGDFKIEAPTIEKLLGLYCRFSAANERVCKWHRAGGLYF